MDVRLELSANDRQSDRAAIFDPLIEYNKAIVGDPVLLPLNILVRGDGETVLGGLTACTAYGWLSIDLLYLPEDLRKQGLGKRLLQAAESEAIVRSCHSARLDTHEFQGARGFYEKNGYETYGEIADYPTGYPRYFMKKSLA